jgi:hypothetical protein
MMFEQIWNGGYDLGEVLLRVTSCAMRRTIALGWAVRRIESAATALSEPL